MKTPITFNSLFTAGYNSNETDEGIRFTKQIPISKHLNPTNEQLLVCVGYYDHYEMSSDPFVFLSSHYDTCGNAKDKQGNWLTKTAYQYTPMPGIQTMEDLATLEKFLTYSHDN